MMELNSKRKQVTLPIIEKYEILEKLDRGITKSAILKDYGIGRTTLFHIKKQREKILKAISDTDDKKKMFERKSFRGPKQVDFDEALYEWFSSKQKEGLPMSGRLIIAKAKSLKKEMNITTDMKFSQGWLRSFKSRHGIRLRTATDTKAESQNTFEATQLLNTMLNSSHQSLDFDMSIRQYNKNNVEFFDKKITEGHFEGSISSDQKNSKKNNTEFFDEKKTQDHFEEPISSELEDSNEEISWDNAEKSMELVIKFLEYNPCFSDDLVMQALAVQKEMMKKKLEIRKVLEFHVSLRNAIEVSMTPTNEEREKIIEAHSTNE